MASAASSRSYRSRQKLEVFKHYGLCCHWCKEDDLDVLSIDHTNNDGGKHRKETGLKGTRFYTWLKASGWPKGFKTLCFNCNFSKHKNGGVLGVWRFRTRRRAR